VIIFIFSTGVFILDQVIKFLFFKFWPYYTKLGTNSLLGGNKGAIIFSLFFIILLFGLFLRDRKIIVKNFWPSLGIGFCFGGAVSNLLDRILRKGVLDISFFFLNTNLADILVFLGLIILLIFYFSRKDIESHIG